jgi:hypothetical protein
MQMKGREQAALADKSQNQAGDRREKDGRIRPEPPPEPSFAP